MEWLNSGTSPSCRELRRCFEAVLHVLKALEPCPSSYPKDVKKCLMKCGVEDKVQVFLFCFLAAFLPIVVPPCWSVEVNSPSALALKLQLRRHPNCQRGFCRSHQQRLEQHSAQCLSEKSKKAAEWCSAVWRFCIWHRLALTSNDYALFEVVMCPICMQTRFHCTYQVPSRWRIFWQHRWRYMIKWYQLYLNVTEYQWQKDKKRIRLAIFLGRPWAASSVTILWQLQDMEAISGACRQLCQTLRTMHDVVDM